MVLFIYLAAVGACIACFLLGIAVMKLFGLLD
ncbi:hypothetical protein AnaeK_3960 [Anaeromyxobacter sp. K]|nr:hypothetical protein AnaeK_3960 [Anaeromyxobacter sp. K]